MASGPAHTRLEGHRRAKRTDARDVLQRGETYNAVIKDANNDGTGAPMAELEKVKTFIYPGPGIRQEQLHVGRSVRVKISDVGDNHAKALVVALLE